MADNVAITAGSGTSVATDQVGSDHYQRVKISDGTADSSTHLKVVAEDAAHSTGDTGLVLMAVRSDTAAALAGTDGDYMPLIVDATGHLWVALSATDNAVLDTIETNTDFGAVVGGGVEASALRVTIANDSTGVVSVDDGGGALTVDGTVTANLSATDNAVLDTIETNTDFGTVVGGGVEATALRVTLASDSTGTLSVDDGGGALTVDGTVTETNSAAILADTANIDTNIGTVAGAVSGTEMQVDVVAALPAGDNNIGNVDIASALPAGTNAIGKLAANSGVDIGDVDILSIAAGENMIGLVGASDNVVTITCSLPTGALTAGDVMFDTQEVAAAARTSGGEVILQSVQVLDKDDQAADFDLVFLDANTSIGTEDSAVSITDANAEDILGHVSITSSDYCDLVGSQIATKTGIGLAMQASGSTSLYVAGITRGTPTYTASGVLIKFAFLRS